MDWSQILPWATVGLSALSALMLLALLIRQGRFSRRQTRQQSALREEMLRGLDQQWEDISAALQDASG